MNTVKLYEADAYLGEFTATVKKCISEAGIYKVELDQTAFYPEGGGQPADQERWETPGFWMCRKWTERSGIPLPSCWNRKGGCRKA